MYGNTNCALGLYEGAFASRVLGQNLETLAPFSSIVAGALAWRSGPGGILQGRFGWGNPATGFVLNSQTTPADVFGVIIPLQSVNGANGGVVGGPAALGGPLATWTWQTWDNIYKAWRLRAGILATMMNSGNFWLKFAAGANYGDTVYASLTDGSAISGDSTGAAETSFFVVSNGGPGCLAIVSSTSKFF
jgi:hypothetical protein